MNAPVISLRQIATVHNSVSDQRDDGWGDVESEIHFDPGLAGGLEGIDWFSHAIVVFLMHESTFDAERDLLRRPRGRDDIAETGIFAQRAKHRPNPIGITAVRVLGREANVLRVRGLDAIDGTPVLDVKPYFPIFDRVEDASTPAWVDALMKDYF